MKRVAASFLPPIAIQANGGLPMYRQLYEWFRHAILAGQLRPGQRIPSTRSLAAELRVSRVPVASAYEQLQAEGYLETFVGAGTCVAHSIPSEAVSRGGAKPAVIARQEAREQAPRQISRRVESTRLAPQPWLEHYGAFRVGLPALEHFPVALWAKLVNRYSRNQTRKLMAYGDAMGYWPLREAIAEYLGAFRAVRCRPSQLLVTTGAQQGIQLSAQVLLDAGDRVWMEEPGYPGARRALMTAGARPVAVPVDGEGLNVAEGVRRANSARAVYITPSHQYPLGVTMTAARRMLLLQWAARRGAWIIEDDYDSEYRFEGRPIPSLQGLDTADRVIYAGTFSKVMFPAMRLGYLVVPEDLVDAFAGARDATDQFSSTVYQAAMTDFIREGHFARHIRRMRLLYDQRRNALVEAIRKHMGHTLEIIGAGAGMHLVALLPAGADDRAISREAASHRMSVMPLSSCYAEKPARDGLILGYGCTDERQIHAAVRRFAASSSFVTPRAG